MHHEFTTTNTSLFFSAFPFGSRNSRLSYLSTSVLNLFLFSIPPQISTCSLVLLGECVLAAEAIKSGPSPRFT